jgi:hypothetical protein
MPSILTTSSRAHHVSGRSSPASSIAADYGRFASLADLLRQIGHDERVHKLASLAGHDTARRNQGRSGLDGSARDGNPMYAWPYAERHVWRSPHMPLAGRVLERVTRARPPTH